MSQERTEQFAFDPEKVKQLLMDLVNDSLIHGLPISSQKYVLADLAEAHDEIARLQAALRRIGEPSLGPTCALAIERRQIALDKLMEANRDE